MSPGRPRKSSWRWKGTVAWGGDLLVALPPPVDVFSLLSGHCCGFIWWHLLVVPAGGWDDGERGLAGSARLVGSVPGTRVLLSLLSPCHPCTCVPGPSISVIALSKRLGCLVALKEGTTPKALFWGWQDTFIPPPMAGPWTSPLCLWLCRGTDESVLGLLSCIWKHSCSYRACCRFG